MSNGPQTNRNWPNTPLSATKSIVSASDTLGGLPSKVKCFDEYKEEFTTFDPSDDEWRIEANARARILKFCGLPLDEKHLLKHFAINRLHRNPHTGMAYVSELLKAKKHREKLLEAALHGPVEGLRYLQLQLPHNCPSMTFYNAARGLLYFFSKFSLAHWSDGHANSIRSIRSPYKISRFRTVRDGSSIISLDEERAIVCYFDDLNANLIQFGVTHYSPVELRNANILFWHFAHGIRPIQIANRKLLNVRMREPKDSQPIVHLTFRYAKQPGAKKALEQTRKMKREWTAMMAGWLRYRKDKELCPRLDVANSLFGLSPQKIRKAIAELTQKITGIPRTPYQLRHSAAQRKADSGCSRLEIAEFLMHQSIETSAVYVQMSPTQAQKINAALGLSPLFQAIDTALKDRSIDQIEFTKLPPDKQIGSAPHGHLIAGIGGCTIGQSFCSRTPALSCYDCHKFMFLKDLDVHRSAEKSVNSIIREFVEVGKTTKVSPAYSQLRRIAETINAIISDLEGSQKSKA